MNVVYSDEPARLMMLQEESDDETAALAGASPAGAPLGIQMQ